MSNTPTPPKPYNPAEATQGAIPGGGSKARSFTTGVPDDYTTTSGDLPHTVYSRDANGNVVSTKRYYDLNNDAGVLLYQMKPEARKTLLESLKRKGVYGNSTPGNGFEDKDIRAFTSVLDYANKTGKPWAESWAEYFKSVPDSTSSKNGAPRKLSNSDDLKAVFKKSASDLLGHSLSQEEEERFVKFYQGMESKGTESSAGVSASNQVQKRFAGEAQSYRAGGLAEIMDQMIARLGS